MKKQFLLLLITVCLGMVTGCISFFTYDFASVLQQTKKEHGLRVIKYDGQLADSKSIRKYSIKGTYFDLGYQLGLIAKKTIIGPKRRTPENQKLNREIEQMYTKLYPRYLEEIAGIAKAYHMKLQDIDLVDMEYDFFINLGWMGLDYENRKAKAFKGFKSGCSIISYNIKENGVSRPIVGRNFGWRQPNGYFVRTNLQGVYKSIGMTIISLNHWVMDGINEKGLFIGVMSLVDEVSGYFGYQPYPDTPAIDAHHMMRIVLDTCADVPEAVHFLNQVRLWFPDEMGHFLIADAKGNSVVVEVNAKGKILYTYPEKNYLIATNTAYYPGPIYLHASARYSVADYLLQKNHIHSMADLFQVMKTINLSKNNPYYNFVMYRGYVQYADYVQEYYLSMYDLKERKLMLYLLENGFKTPYEFGFD